jgi:uncharacterized protein YcaQ
MTAPHLTNLQARRLFLARHGLFAPPCGGGKRPDITVTIHALGFVQIDSVNTLARAHDHILWSRRPAFRPDMLHALHARDRAVFEHWTHDASFIPVDFFPHWRLRFTRDAARLAPRWRNWRGTFEDHFDSVLSRIARDGECTSGDLAPATPRKGTGWWDWHPSKTALEYLWRTGQIAVKRRDGFRKVYDLTERVIPATHLDQKPQEHETIDWACASALDRLGFASPQELAAFWDLVTVQEARAWCARETAAHRLIGITLALADGTARSAHTRPDTPEDAANLPPASDRVRLLSPFDPALRDRMRAERLFGFHYRIEIYVPAPKRTYGYYVFPVLEGETLIGRLDAKARRDTGTLAVRAFWLERGIHMGKGRIARFMAELDRAARLAGCDRVDLAPDWLRA